MPPFPMMGPQGPLSNAYSRAISQAGGFPPPMAAPFAQAFPGGGPGPAMAALPRTPVDIDPRSQTGDVFFLDPGLLPQGMEKPSKGDELVIRVGIESVGSKIACRPLEVLGEREEGEEVEPYETGSGQQPTSDEQGGMPTADQDKR